MAITMDFTLLLLSNMQVGFWGGGNMCMCVCWYLMIVIFHISRLLIWLVIFD